MSLLDNYLHDAENAGHYSQVFDSNKFLIAIAFTALVGCIFAGGVYAVKTADIKPTDPHKNRHYNTEADCNLCHHQHGKSENFCLPCHDRFNFHVP